MSKFLRIITFLVLKLMGIKKGFSQDPIDYQKIRRQDVKNPPKYFFRKFRVEENKLADSKLYSLSNNCGGEGLILYVQGGAFISGPAKHHWDAIDTIISNTKKTVWMIDYPKAPEHHIDQINQNIDAVYAAALLDFNADEIILIGDSVGATLIMTLTQRLIQSDKKVPARLILITPVFDCSMTNPVIDEIEKVDPMLSKVGVLSAKKMCADDLDLKNSTISPLYGDFKDFPETKIYIGGKDIMAPDSQLGVEKMKAASVNVDVNYEPEMPHIYPLLPMMKEAKKALSTIIDSV